MEAQPNRATTIGAGLVITTFCVAMLLFAHPSPPAVVVLLIGLGIGGWVAWSGHSIGRRHPVTGRSSDTVSVPVEADFSESPSRDRKAKIILAFVVAGAVLFLVLEAFAAPPEITVEKPARCRATIYPEGFAVMQERRWAEIPEGPSRLAVRGLPETIEGIPRLRAPGVAILGVRVEGEDVTPSNLLAGSVGSEVLVVMPGLGDEPREARLLSVSDGAPIFEIDGAIVTGQPQRILYPSLPEELRAGRRLIIDVATTEAGRHELDLAYVAGGFSWHGEHLAEIVPEREELDFQSWAEIRNHTETALANCRVELVVGRTASNNPVVLARAMPAISQSPTEARSDTLGDRHRIALPDPVSLRGDRVLSLPLFSAAGIVAKRSLIMDMPALSTRSEVIGKPRVEWSFRNDSGRPLAPGSLRLFQRDSSGAVRLLGRSSFGGAAIGEAVTLPSGEAFDVTVTSVVRRQTRPSEKVTETLVDVVIRNAAAKPASLTLLRRFYGMWEVLDGPKTDEESAGTGRWSVSVPANGQTHLVQRFRETAAR